MCHILSIVRATACVRAALSVLFLIRRLHRIHKRITRRHSTPTLTMLHITHETAQHTRCTRKIIERYNRLIESARCHTFPRSTLHTPRCTHCCAALARSRRAPESHPAIRPCHSPTLARCWFVHRSSHPVCRKPQPAHHRRPCVRWKAPSAEHARKHTRTHTHAHTSTRTPTSVPHTRTHHHTGTHTTIPNTLPSPESPQTTKSCCVWHVCACECGPPANCTLLLLLSV